MIPLTIFLLVWLLLLVIYLLFSMVTVVQMLRYSVAGPMAYISTAIFLGVTVITLFSSGLYLVNVDWSQALNLGGLFKAPDLTL